MTARHTWVTTRPSSKARIHIRHSRRGMAMTSGLSVLLMTGQDESKIAVPRDPKTNTHHC